MPWVAPFVLEVFHMTKEQEQRYQDTDELRKIIKQLKGSRYRLDCGHHISFGHTFGNNITIINGKEPKIICSQCGY